jgi:small subunit ribosomal protein S17
MSEAQNTTEQARGTRRVRQGRVVSDKMDKTVVVTVESRVRHPLYGRIVRRTKRYKAHDETNQYHVGDLVEIVECRPLSREKNWRVSRLLEAAR